MLYRWMRVNGPRADKLLGRCSVSPFFTQVMDYGIVMFPKTIATGVKGLSCWVVGWVEGKGVTETIFQTWCGKKTGQGFLKSGLDGISSASLDFLADGLGQLMLRSE